MSVPGQVWPIPDPNARLVDRDLVEPVWGRLKRGEPSHMRQVLNWEDMAGMASQWDDPLMPSGLTQEGWYALADKRRVAGWREYP